MKRSRLILGAILVFASAFAIWPVGRITVATPDLDRVEPVKRQLAALDLAAFRVPIWVAEPPPPTPPAPASAPPPPPPLKLQLLAIIREVEGGAEGAGGWMYKAAVYDADTDRILVVAAGEKLGLRTVEHVDKSSLTLRDETGTRVLALKAEEGGSP